MTLLLRQDDGGAVFVPLTIDRIQACLRRLEHYQHALRRTVPPDEEHYRCMWAGSFADGLTDWAEEQLADAPTVIDDVFDEPSSVSDTMIISRRGLQFTCKGAWESEPVSPDHLKDLLSSD
jgi:hypothetical protein